MPTKVDELINRLNALPNSVAREFSQILAAFDAENMSDNAFNNRLFDETFAALQNFFLSIPINFAEMKIIRSRRIDRQTLYENIAQINYPPKDRANLNRANFDGQSIFYGSNSLETTFQECRVTEGTGAVTGQFALNEGQALSLIVTGEVDHVRRHHRTWIEAPGVGERLSKISDSLNPDARNAYYLCDAFLANYFRREENTAGRKIYQFTARLANILYGLPGIDGILYPSMAYNGGINAALKPDVINEKFSLEKFSASNVVRDFAFGVQEICIHAHGTETDDDGNFRWHMEQVYKGSQLRARAMIPYERP